MKIALLALCLSLLSKATYAQQKISGTVTYFYNNYQGNKADVGAQVFCIDSIAANLDIIEKLERIAGSARYYEQYINDSLEVVARHRRRKETDIVPQRGMEGMRRWGIDGVLAFKEIDKALSIPTMLDKYTINGEKSDKRQVDGVGNYSFTNRKVGTYYVIIKSANRNSPYIGIMLLGRIYIEKVTVKEGDENNVSINFEL